MKKFVEVIKANKKVIIKRGLIILGTLAGLAVVDALRNRKDEDECDDFELVEDTTENEDGDSQED